MAIANTGASFIGVNISSSGTDTYTKTIPAGTNFIVLAAVAGVVGSAFNISGITVGGQAMTQVSSSPAKSNGGAPRWFSTWVLIGGPTGSQPFVVSSTSGSLNCCIASFYSGVGSVDNNSFTAAATAVASLTASVTPVASGCWVIGASTVQNSAGDAPVAGAGATLRQNDNAAGLGIVGLFDSNGTVTAGSPYSMTTTTTGPAGNDFLTTFMVSLAPPGAPAFLPEPPPRLQIWI